MTLGLWRLALTKKTIQHDKLFVKLTFPYRTATTTVRQSF
jgi:hypothetical protein